MSSRLSVIVLDSVVGRIFKEESDYIFNYVPSSGSEKFVSLTMPVREKSYVNSGLHPIFEMHLPEGYLLAILKKHFAKVTETDDFGMLRLLAPSMSGRIQYESQEISTFPPLSLDEILHPNTQNLFDELVDRFALSSPLSGVQPKVLARIVDKATLKLEDYIVKAWGDDYPQLALNEYLCMQAVQAAEISVPEFYLSDDHQLFIMKRFDIQGGGRSLGFEDLCVLQARQREDKYKGSYEQVAKSLKLFCSKQYRLKSLTQFFKMIVMNNFLENGDAHLKNFGVYYPNIDQVQIAPAYDVVNTTVYVTNDIPALTLLGSKRWHKKEQLIRFAIEACDLTNKQALKCYEDCLYGMTLLLSEVNQWLEQEPKPDVHKLLIKLQRLAKQALEL